MDHVPMAFDSPVLGRKIVSFSSSPAFVYFSLLLWFQTFPLSVLRPFSAGPWTPLSLVRSTHFLVTSHLLPTH